MELQRLISSEESVGEKDISSETSLDAEEYTAEQVIESMKWGRFHWFLLVIVGVFKMMDMLEVMLLTVLFPVVQCEWHLSELQSSLLSVVSERARIDKPHPVQVVFTGMLFGATFWGTISDKFGRKPTVFIATALVAYHGFLGSFSPNIYWLYVLRFIVGVGISAALNLEVVLAEFVATQYRASAVIALRAFEAVGSMFVVLLAWAVIPTLGWRYMVAFIAVPVTLFLFLWPVVPESVRFLLVSGQQEKAVMALTRATAMNRCRLPAGKLRTKVVEDRGRLRDLFKPEYRRTTLQVFYIFATATATYYGTSLVTTGLIHMNYCAAAPNATSSSRPSSDACGCSSLSSSNYGRIALTTLAELAVLPIAIALSDLIGRRRALAVCQTTIALSYLLLLTCVGSTSGVTVILFIARGFAISSSAIIHLYVPEVFPTQIRAIGASSGYFVGRVGAIVTPLISQLLLRTSVHSALSTYAIMSILSAIVALLLPIETRGRRME